MDKIQIYFDGPFSFSNNSIFECKYKNSPGIYLWIIKTENGNMIHYIGETINFAKRQKEHLINILGFYYGIFDVNKAKEGNSVLLWKGLWRDKSDNLTSELLSNYQKLNPLVIDYVNCINIYFAEIDIDSNLRKHIEGSIGWNLRNKYKDYKVLYPDDNHIGMMANKLNRNLIINSSEIILGLDKEMII
jgi:hypothetical protein